jgi:hypothetical protein
MFCPAGERVGSPPLSREECGSLTAGASPAGGTTVARVSAARMRPEWSDTGLIFPRRLVPVARAAGGYSGGREWLD